MIRTKVLATTDQGEQLIQFEMPNGDVTTQLSDVQGLMLSAVIDEWNAYGKRASRLPTTFLGHLY